MPRSVATHVAWISGLTLAGFAASASADRLPEHAPRVVDYQISVRLDADKKALDGSQRVVWTNPSQDAVGELWFHLYLNAFKNTGSTFFRESGGQLRGDRASADKWGFIDVTALRLADGTDLLPAYGFEHPDDDNAADQSVARVRLPKPVPAGGNVTLEIRFHAQLPQVFARTGFRRDFFLAGQWFPKLGVYEPAGTRGRVAGGWNCHQFHANSEFYADYGRFHVEITAPARFVVGATGPRIETRSNADGSKTYVHEQSDVHDFAWTADPNYLEIKRDFSATRDVSPAEYERTARLVSRSLEEVRLRDVAITLLLQPGHQPQAERQIEAAKLAIKQFGLAYGAYPYPTLTIVDPAPGALGAGGMEYPTFITGGTSFVLNRWPFDRVRLPEEVVVHEFGHQFWYGLVGNNEFEEAWLDEGFNSYSTGKFMEQAYGKDAGTLYLLGLKLAVVETERLQNGMDRRFDRIHTAAWAFSPGNYSFNAYARPALVLRTLESWIGEAAMARVMRTFHERFRFRHPSSDEFYAVAAEVSGRDLAGYFGQVVEAPGVLDDAVVSIESVRRSEDRGVIDSAGRRETINDEAAKQKEEQAEQRKSRLYSSTVLLRRLGEVSLPVDVELRFEGVPPEHRTFEPGSRWARFQYERREKLLSATLAPRPLDANRLNDSRRSDPDGRAAARWGASVLFLLQQALAFLGM